MIEKRLEVKSLKNTETNIKFLTALGEREACKEYHVLVNKKRAVLVMHHLWFDCQYCNLDTEGTGIIDMT